MYAVTDVLSVERRDLGREIAAECGRDAGVVGSEWSVAVGSKA